MAAGDVRDAAAEERLSRPTIFALASGSPPSAIAVVRVSGPRAFAVLEALTGGTMPRPRRLVRRTLRWHGEILDAPLVAVFPAPESATGDDVVELHLHGGRAVVAAVLRALLDAELTPARPGEFTRRAFDNGKLDLGQVEALGDLVAAETETQRRAALARTGTDLAQRVDRWRATLLDLRADLEAVLDFSDQDGVETGLGATSRAELARLIAELRQAEDDGRRGELLTRGITVAIVGPVNAGKSSLLNALARRDVAMVSAHPGTTRDALETRLNLGGNLVTLIDTAGLRENVDGLEAEGIERGLALAAAADLVIDFGETPPPHHIHVAGKGDLTGMTGWQGSTLHLSPRTGAGLALLEQNLRERIDRLARPADVPMLAHRWQTEAVAAARQALVEAVEEPCIVLAAELLRQANRALGRLLGQGSSEELLDHVFARFCIGK